MNRDDWLDLRLADIEDAERYPDDAADQAAEEAHEKRVAEALGLVRADSPPLDVIERARRLVQP